MVNVKAVPEGFHTVTPHLAVKGAGQAIDFYKRAFGAKERYRMPGPDGKSIMHAEVQIGDSILMLADEMEGMGARSPKSAGGTTVALHLYVDDCDTFFKRAVDAGAKVQMPLSDVFWGDRYGKLLDPFGHEWSISTHKRDLSPDQIKKEQEAFFAKMPKGQPSGKQ